MKNRASKQTEEQAENEVQQIIALSFEEFTRDAPRRAAWGMMMEEVEALCGPRYRPTRGSAHRRAGTEKGVLRHGVRGSGQSRYVAGFQKLRAKQTSANLFDPLRGRVPEGQGVHAELNSR